MRATVPRSSWHWRTAQWCVHRTSSDCRAGLRAHRSRAARGARSDFGPASSTVPGGEYLFERQFTEVPVPATTAIIVHLEQVVSVLPGLRAPVRLQAFRVRTARVPRVMTIDLAECIVEETFIVEHCRDVRGRTS